MKAHIYLVLIMLIMFGEKVSAQIPNWAWAKNASGSQYDQSSAIATDATGNIYVTGYFSSDSILFDSFKLYNNTPGFGDLFIAKYNSSGDVIWVKAAGGNFDDKGYSVTTDNNENVYLTGSFYSSEIIFGNDTLKNAGVVSDIFIVKFDKDGNILWSKREGGPAVEIPYAIKTDFYGNIYVAGRFSSLSISFGGTTLTQTGSMDVFIVKYDSDGNFLWAKGAGSTSNDEAYALACDNEGNVFMAGYYNKSITFGGNTVTSLGQADGFLVKYDSTGDVKWAVSSGGNNDDRITGIAVDELGNCYVSGYFQSTSVDFTSESLSNFYTQGIENALIAKFDSNGNNTWAQAVDGKSKALGISVVNSNVYVCGPFTRDTLNYGSSLLELNGTSDFFLLNCDSDGNPNWAIKQNSGGESGEYVNSIASDKSGNVFIAGYFDSKPIVFGSTTLNTTGTRFDMFLARLNAMTTGIKNFDFKNSFSIYPNPSDGKFTLQSNSENKTFNVFDFSGKLVYSKKIIQNTITTIDISNLPSGTYLSNLNENGKTLSKKLVVTRR